MMLESLMRPTNETPAQYRGAALPDFPKAVRDAVTAWLQNGPSLLTLTGRAGTGKTRLLYAITPHLAQPVRFWSIPMMVLELQAAASDDMAAYRKLVNAFCGSESWDTGELRDHQRLFSCLSSLLMDDLGAEKVTPFTASAISAIISQREHFERTTVISTNLSLAEINKTWGSRTADRIAGGTIIEFMGKSRRQK